MGVQLTVDSSDDLDVTVRLVGYVPMKHLNTDDDPEWEGAEHVPGLVPDPLLPISFKEKDGDSSTTIGPRETHSFWITVRIPTEIEPGLHEIKVKFTVNEVALDDLIARIELSPVTIRPVQDFPVTHWFYADALCDWYGVEPYDDRFWTIVEPYMRNLVEHGGSSQYVPIFTPPTDGIKRPHQLIRVTTPRDGLYEFDFTNVRRWVSLARSCGAKYFEWTHLFSQWGAKNALRIYRSNQDRDSLLWPPETEATSPVYRNFLAQFLPKFYEFLVSEELLDCSLFHISDEPHGEEHLANYRQAREMVRELAPWMKTGDALSDIQFVREGLTDVPIPSISTAKSFVEEGFPAWAYFCCGPRGKYLNRLMDTPLVKIRMSGWLFYRLRARGFLHWGYNYWYKSQTQDLIDPFTEQSGAAWPEWAYGDPFVVYPGQTGPIDSIRWEVFAESLQDMALLQTLGIDPEDPMLSEIHDYDKFPKTSEWIANARQRLLAT
ncbi:MAG: DUF4091 domain-containing protein [Armatimonadetes bacterium]|nr:DUF4091 domain-containing protein [Armatimonadota bacterium]